MKVHGGGAGQRGFTAGQLKTEGKEMFLQLLARERLGVVFLHFVTFRPTNNVKKDCFHYFYREKHKKCSDHLHSSRQSQGA